MPIPISSSSQAGHIVPKLYVSSDFTNIHSLHTPYRLVPIQIIVNFTLEYVMKPKETGRCVLPSGQKMKLAMTAVALSSVWE